jgi:cysteinyl-tRNA synthetase
MIKLYNTLSRSIEDFSPYNQDSASLYTCGPTVYDYQHIGNFRKFVFDDTLRRTLTASGYKVKHVMNITDVGHLVSDADEGEDKLEKGAKRENKSVREVAEHYTNIFKKDAGKLNIFEPNGYHGEKDSYARATDFIDEQIKLIEILLQKEFVYITKQAIYFDISRLADYGILSGQKLSEKGVGVREEVVTDSNKRNPQDFAVWFFLVGRYEHHSMNWPSPWGNGFPGWHLECSAIIHTLLGDPIDIHTGGVDHIGVHHTNEMAQTEAAYGNKLAKYWVHSEHLLVDGQKMSKSLGNFYTLKDIEEKGFDPLALRLFYLQGHYRTQINFTWDNLEAAQHRLNAFNAFADLKWQLKSIPAQSSNSFLNTVTEMREALSDDLNSPIALSILSAFVDVALGHLISTSNAGDLETFLNDIDLLLGLRLSKRQDIDGGLKKLIEQREEARKNQDWQKADKLRSELKEQKIEINDTEHGPIWYRT